MTASKLEEYVIQKRIAAALFGDVLLCSHTPTGDLVAVKRVLLSAAAAQRTLATDKKVRENVALERALYRHLQTRNGGRGHANVLRLREEIEFDGYLYLVFDYCERGELYEIVSASTDGKLPQPTTRKYMRQIAQGVQFVHQSGYAHRDLSLENVLVTKDDVCQVCDLGLAASASKVSKETVGKLFYMAPEVLAGNRYDPTKADVWSLGVMLFIMLIGAPPVESAATSDARFRLITSQGVRKLIDRWGLTSSLPAAAIDLLAGMLEVDATQRFTIDMVVTHPFLQTQPQPQPPLQRTSSIFRRMPSSFADEILTKQQQMGDGLDAATAGASSSAADAEPRRQSYIKRTINRILRRRSSKRVMAVPPPRQTTVVSECGSTKDCASNGCLAAAA
ncbi:Camk protein kinase [Globisporangium polare]